MNAQDITHALHGRWLGGCGIACCPAHEDGSPSLSIKDGNEGRLLLHCFAGCQFTSILGALGSLGLVSTDYVAPSPDPDRAAKREAEARAASQRKAYQARQLWEVALPIRGTIAETYLRSRGIDCATPAALRFHPETWHGWTATHRPAMIGAVAGGSWFGVHRTFLSEDGTCKAAVDPAKAMLGPVKGGAVRLSTMAGAPLLVAEGIETALSAAALYGRRASVWAALSAPGMAGLILPVNRGELIVATDGDRAGTEAGHALAHVAQRAGWRVATMAAPDGQDWNDVLLREVVA